MHYTTINPTTLSNLHKTPSPRNPYGLPSHLTYIDILLGQHLSDDFIQESLSVFGEDAILILIDALFNTGRNYFLNSEKTRNILEILPDGCVMDLATGEIIN